MSHDAVAAWGAETTTRKKAQDLEDQLEDEGRGIRVESKQFPSGNLDDPRGFVYADRSIISTMRERPFVIPDPDPKWVEAFRRVGLEGRWYVWLER